MALFIISGPSQSGKTTLVNLLLKEKDVHRIITSTSRKPRPGEKNNKDFYFLNESDFKDTSKFVETAIVHGNHYGTLKKELKDKLKTNKKVLLNIDVQGAKNILENYKDLPKDTITIFLTTEKLSALIERIKLRNDPNFKERIETIKKELKYIPLFKYIINTSISLEESLEQIKAVVFDNKKKLKEVEEFTKNFDKEKFLNS
ncbi:guanylate kinase [Candidatus Woesearchaeota archaeon]|nr:guanylate kinase [Candidatus Woesearchaeota archaeon]